MQRRKLTRSMTALWTSSCALPRRFCTSFLTSTLLLEDVSIVSGSSRVVVFVFDFVLGLNSGATGVEEETNEVFLDLKNEVMPGEDEVEEEGGVVEFFS